MGHITGEWSDKTIVALEFPKMHVNGVTEPYYPIPTIKNNLLYNKYLEFAKFETPNVVFAGRLGDYKYYNMDQAVARALSLFERLSKQNNS